MRPIEAFNDTHSRAVRLLRYHDGLVNTRKRAIRSDWAANFCRLMQWPLSHDIQRVDSADVVLVLRDGAALAPDDFSAAALEDLLRSAITFGVSAIDRYVHERIVKAFVTAFRSSTLTKHQREFQVPATLAIEIVNKVHGARRTARNIRPANEIRKVVQQTLHKRPFQSWREIEYGFSLIGVKDLGKSLRDAHGISVKDMDDLKMQLNKIVARRNQIVHEGDLPRHQRGGQVYVQEIRRLWVEESLHFMEDFAVKLDAIT
ncbi:MAG: hypothetical protein K0R79_3775 [Stenotrophomonas indicatrix]|nr:hypothetical protein [Stenotrophomonas indicatrix]